MPNKTRRYLAAQAGLATYDSAPMLCGHVTRDTSTGACHICRVNRVPKSDRTGARAAAKAAGEPFYIGTPCAHGHDGKRYTSKGQCYTCQMQSSKARDHKTDHVRTRRNAWRSANYFVNMAIETRAHCIERGSTCDRTVTAAFLEQLWLAQGGCAYCGTTDNATLDHKTPLARGGIHTAGNVQWLCKPHNSSKANQTDQEYRDRHLIADHTPWDAL